MYNSYELGFRVPLIVISRYAKKGFVSHRLHEFGSILKFIERHFSFGFARNHRRALRRPIRVLRLQSGAA